MRCHLSAALWRTDTSDEDFFSTAIPELSRVQAFSGKLLTSRRGKCRVSLHQPTVPEHRFRESRQMALGDSLSGSGPHGPTRPALGGPDARGGAGHDGRPATPRPESAP